MSQHEYLKIKIISKSAFMSENDNIPFYVIHYTCMFKCFDLYNNLVAAATSEGSEDTAHMRNVAN